nr:glycosyltransferase family 2 protein [uncultured Amphritea sp.]
MPTVSIITPMYDCERYVSLCIESVLNQTFYDWELLVVDDCSTDASYQIVKSFSDHRIKLFKLDENSGAAVARNYAIRKASGRFIAFLDSDDLWLPCKLEKHINFMLKKSIAFSYSSYYKINDNGDMLTEISVPLSVCYSQLLKTNVIGCLTAVYDTKVFGKVEMPQIRKRQDFGLWLKLLKRTGEAVAIDESLSLYRTRANSISNNKLDAAKYTWRLYRDVENLPWLKCVYYFCFYALGGFLRSRYPKLAKALGFFC